MGNGLKIGLIVAGSCILGGILLSAAGAMGGGVSQLCQYGGYAGDNTQGETNAMHGMIEKTFSAESKAVQRLVVQDQNNAVELRASTDGRLRVDYAVNDYETYDVSLDDGALTVTYRRIRERWGILGTSLPREDLVLYLPEGFSGEIDVRTSNGEVKGENLTLGGRLSLESSNGAVRLRETEISGKVEITTANGAVTLTGVTVRGELSAQTSNASITAEELAVENAELATSNGRIVLENVASGENIQARTRNDSIQANNCAALAGIELRTENGRIHAEGVDGGKSVVFETRNASIVASLSGANTDYTIESRTSNGKNNLPTQWKGGQRKLEATTSNGDIEISFMED